MGNGVSCAGKDPLPVVMDSSSESVLTPIGSPEPVSEAMSEEPSLVQSSPFGGAVALWASGSSIDPGPPTPRGFALDYSPMWSFSVDDWDDLDDSGAINNIDDEEFLRLLLLQSRPEPEHSGTTDETSSGLNGSQFASLMGLIYDSDRNCESAISDQRITFARVVNCAQERPHRDEQFKR